MKENNDSFLSSQKAVQADSPAYFRSAAAQPPCLRPTSGYYRASPEKGLQYLSSILPWLPVPVFQPRTSHLHGGREALYWWSC